MEHAARRVAATLLFVSTLVSTSLLVACSSSTPTAPATAPAGTTSGSAPTPAPTASACGVLTGGQLQLKIVNGSDCSSASSSVVFLNRRDSNGQSIATGCSGTVIGPRAVLTAAHCLSGVSSMTIALGNQDIPAVSATASPNSQDVAVVLTGQDIPRVAFALLSSRDVSVGERAVVAGWGVDGNGGAISLRAGTADVSGVSGNYIQTQYVAGGSGSGLCTGDSGGALLVFQGSEWVLAGIPVSISAGCTQTGTDSFVNIRNANVTSFIASAAPGVTWR